ncbi:MAG: hypothetical protein Q8P57_01145 [Candidatus Pacearchaeota archaeon]|nr:hypothetical protein [Candidatus Pacearchaeota archaeon]
MVEIKVYETIEEAKQHLERYEQNNREAFDGFVKRQGESASERLGKQTYFFVAELAAYVDDGPDQFYFESVAFPFLEDADLYGDVQSLADGVKEAVRHQTPKNIETILYTVRNHDYPEGFEVKVDGVTKYVKNLSPDELNEEDREELYKDLDEVGKENLNGLLQELRKLQEGHQTRALTDKERQEFVRLYSEK